MIREIVTPKSENYYINIPKKYINKKVEILVLPFETLTEDRSETKEQDIISQTRGILSTKKIDPLTWQSNIRDEYERQ